MIFFTSTTVSVVTLIFFYQDKIHEIYNCKSKEGSVKISVNYLDLNFLVQKSLIMGPEVAMVESKMIKCLFPLLLADLDTKYRNETEIHKNKIVTLMEPICLLITVSRMWIKLSSDF